MLKFILPVLLLQFAAGASDNCSSEVVATKKVTDLQQLIGEWNGVYIWNHINTLNLLQMSLCIKSTVSAVSQTEVESMKTLCHDNVKFDWSNVKLKITTRFLPARLISTDGTYAYILQFCQIVAKAEVRQTNNGYVLMTYPDLRNFTELFSKEVPTKGDLKCLAENVDVMKTMSGFPLCYKE